MATEPFSHYYLVNFNETIKLDNLPNNSLRRVWSCKWTATNLEEILLDWCLRCSIENESLSEKISEELFCNAIQLALICVQQNFTGPFDQLEEFSAVISKIKLPKCSAEKKLMENGEEINPNVKLGELLVVAKAMIQRLQKQWPYSFFLLWWQMRLICIQQLLLNDLTNNLYTQFKINAEHLLKQLDVVLLDVELQGLLYLEVINGYLQFHRLQKSAELLDELCQRLQIVVVVEGLLGLRTKFQQKALPQLCLKVIQIDGQKLPAAIVTNSDTKLPQLLLLEDDTRLERIRFIDTKDTEVMTLPSVLQALVLTKVKVLKRSQPKDRLADEELEPYIQTLLYQSQGPLQVRQSALLLNCLQESNQRRTVERSWKQCEEVVKLLSAPMDKYSLQSRLSYAFAGSLQTKWTVQLQLCDLLRSLGMTKSALDIYLQLQAWAQVIECYTRLALRHKAAEIIRQQLEKKPTTLLHCLLGDAIDDPKCYVTAWEFSQQTSGRAQAHWGNYHYQRREYAEAIPHLEQSVQINPLQKKIWLQLGYAAIMLERWQLAVHAYITYTHLEPLGFESWNNLAKALIKLGDKPRAHKLLAESLKCNYTNWKVWENFMLVSVDTGHFEDAMNAYSRLSELKDRYLDLEVLCVIMHAIVQGKPDAKGQTPERLQKKAITLMGQQCIKHGNDPMVWELAALLAPTPLNKAQKLMKAYRAYTNKEPAWITTEPQALKALQLCREFCQCSLETVSKHASDETEMMITSQLNSTRLTAQGCVQVVEKQGAQWPGHMAILEELIQLQQRITDVVKERMNAS